MRLPMFHEEICRDDFLSLLDFASRRLIREFKSHLSLSRFCSRRIKFSDSIFGKLCRSVFHIRHTICSISSDHDSLLCLNQSLSFVSFWFWFAIFILYTAYANECREVIDVSRSVYHIRHVKCGICLWVLSASRRDVSRCWCESHVFVRNVPNVATQCS